jgi:hypothetical protein
MDNPEKHEIQDGQTKQQNPQHAKQQNPKHAIYVGHDYE